MNNFNFNQDFFAACSALGGGDGRDLAWAILSYAYTGEEPEGMGDAARACFLMARGRIDAAVAGARAKERRARPSADPMAGGAPDPTANPTAGCAANPTPDPTPDPRDRKRRRRSKEIETNRAGACAGGLEEPDEAEVAAWFQANSPLPSSVAEAEAAKFLDHFAAQGWVTGAGVPIVNWQAKARAWVARTLELRQREGARSSPRRAAPAADFSAYAATDGVVAHG
ncbi:hypothetical protein [Parolsenella catena]|jgi:hypothetical protein|uniref:hypothetical protein n=1 Tax=Parolsenella catena TaxID=2003188 RepID=UPI0020628099|nr:MAG TPA: hypothetical protein [Caudoviricetes sp.]